MPATGPRAPARTLVAVRAIVPVTQMPPNSAEADVGDALRHQLAIRAVPPAGHAVGDHGREQALDAAEQREGQRGRQHRRRSSPSERPGSCGAGSELRDAAEARADGLDRQAEAASRDADASATAIRMPGQCGRNRRTATIDGDRQRAPAPRPTALKVGSAAAERRELRDERARLLPGSVRPSSSLSWLAKMMTAMPGGEADGHRIGDVLDEGAEPQQPDREQDEPGQERREDQPVDAVRARRSPPPAR